MVSARGQQTLLCKVAKTYPITLIVGPKYLLDRSTYKLHHHAACNIGNRQQQVASSDLSRLLVLQAAVFCDVSKIRGRLEDREIYP